MGVFGLRLDCYMPVRLISGRGCVKANGSVFSSAGKRCLIVTSGTAAKKSGALDDVRAVLNSEGIEYGVFDGITENPLLSSCEKAGKSAYDASAQFIIGIGGGSPLDSAKAAAIFAANPSLTGEEIYKRAVPSPALPVILIGTTSGTGSEVTGVSVLTNDATGMKKSISGADCYASVSFLDSTYTSSMPYSVTVSTALDAFAHAAEGWFSAKTSELSDAYASLALPAVYKGLESLLKTKALPDAGGREKLYLASIYAGLALNITKAGFPHTVGYVLSEDYGIPHGRACTAFLPLLLSRGKQLLPDRYEKLLALLKTDGETLVDTVSLLTDVHISISAEKAHEYAARWNAQSANFVNSPGGFTAEDAEKALSSIK